MFTNITDILYFLFVSNFCNFKVKHLFINNISIIICGVWYVNKKHEAENIVL